MLDNVLLDELMERYFEVRDDLPENVNELNVCDYVLMRVLCDRVLMLYVSAIT